MGLVSLLGLGGLLAWRHRRTWTVTLGGLVRPTPAAAPPTTSPYARRPAHGHSADAERGATRGELARAVPPLLAQLPSMNPSTVSTTQLCGAWQRSYWLLLELPPGPSRNEVMHIRRHVFDELERRDPTGFSRGLHTEPRAGSHPGRFLIADN